MTTAISEFSRKHFKGEHLPEEDKHKITKKETVTTISKSLLLAAASVKGFKSFVDVPRWFAQKYYTGAEKKRIEDAVYGQDITEEETPVDQKKKATEEAVSESRHLSPEQKKKLSKELEEIIDRYEANLGETVLEKGEAVAKVLDGAIQTRVKGATAIKETISTALLFSGFETLRVLGYGAVALFERYQHVKEGKEKGERKESFAKEMIVNGFKETVQAIAFNRGKTKRERVMNATKALGSVATFAGLEHIGLEGARKSVVALLKSNETSEAIDKVLDFFEQTETVGTGIEELAEKSVEHTAEHVLKAA